MFMIHGTKELCAPVSSLSFGYICTVKSGKKIESQFTTYVSKKET